MSRWLQMVESGESETLTPSDNKTKPDKTPQTQPKDAFCQVLSNCQAGVEEKPKRPKRWSVGGRPMTETGRIVSLVEWRKLSSSNDGPDHP